MNYENLDNVVSFLNSEPLLLAPPYYDLRFVPVTAEGVTVQNPVVNIKTSGALYRGRSEIIIIKDNMVYINYDKTEKISSYKAGFGYNIPGGGWDMNEAHDISAAREAREEVRINVKNVKFAGNYAVEYNYPLPWVAIHVPKNIQWLGYYTEVFVGEFDSKYTGKIADHDKDSMIKTGKFVPISKVYNKLNPVHKRAIDIYYANKQD